MNPSVEVSVVVPTFNGAEFLLETLEHIERQTFTSWQVLVVVDGSTDESVKLFRESRFAHDSRFRLIEIENQGVSEARNKGIKLSDTPYVALLDHDDLWHEKKLEYQIQALRENPKLIACLCWFLVTAKQQDKLIHKRLVRHFNFEKLIRGWVTLSGNGALISSTMVFRQSEIKRLFDPSFNAVSDLDFTLRLAKSGQIGILQMPLVAYRVHYSQMHFRPTSMCEYLDSIDLMDFDNFHIDRVKVVSNATAMLTLLEIYQLRGRVLRSIKRISSLIRTAGVLPLVRVIFFILKKRLVGFWYLKLYGRLVRSLWN